MDDFIIILPTKKDCINIKKKIEYFLSTNLKLELNSKSRYYPDKMGVNFCGYRIFTTHKLLRNSSKKKIKANVKKWNSLYNKNQLDIKHSVQCINSWIGHSSHCNSYKLQQQIINKCNFLISPRTLSEMENTFINETLKNADNQL